MAFKHNLPIPVVLLVLAAAAIVGLAILYRPPDEDQIRQAVNRYASTLGRVQQLEIHGSVADILLAEQGRLIYAEFEKKNGEWGYSRNLADEFSKAMKDPEVQKAIAAHLGEKLSKRFHNPSVRITEGITTGFDLARDSDTRELVGQCLLRFAYPQAAGQRRRGEYVERFEWREGRWQSKGPGDLYDLVDR